jgi:hypothetical protein
MPRSVSMWRALHYLQFALMHIILHKPMRTSYLKGCLIGDATDTTENFQMKRLRGIIYQLLHHGFDIGLLNGPEFQDSKVFAFIVERTQHSHAP